MQTDALQNLTEEQREEFGDMYRGCGSEDDVYDLCEEFGVDFDDFMAQEQEAQLAEEGERQMEDARFGF
jgi:hypothetical protein